MAGGVGSRFWPKSRNSCPKQFIDILGVGKSLLQLTYERFLKVCPAENIFIVTNTSYKELIQEQIPGIETNNILCEPSRNNTAPCIAYAAFKIAAKDPEACMVIAPSDHFILKEDVFVENIKHALNVVSRKNILLTLGISPTRPDTGYGYIRYEKVAEDRLHKVVQFTEKPALDKAKEFLASGDYVWNAGIFIWSAKTILAGFDAFSPELYNILSKGADVYNTAREQDFIDTNYPLTPNISIDYAIMEKAPNVFTLPVEFGWSDLGTWASVYQVAEKNGGMNNVLTGGELQLEDTEDCIIHLPDDKLAVIRGLKDYIVVDDKDILLIYPKSSEQEIKKITEKLKQQEKGHYL